MARNLRADPIPIREDTAGALRIDESRVLLELVVRAFEDGASPESIVARYDTLRLDDVYAVIAYYLKNRDEVASYLRDRERQADEVERKVIASQPDLRPIRERLLARRNPMGRDDAPAGE